MADQAATPTVPHPSLVQSQVPATGVVTSLEPQVLYHGGKRKAMLGST